MRLPRPLQQPPEGRQGRGAREQPPRNCAVRAVRDEAAPRAVASRGRAARSLSPVLAGPLARVPLREGEARASRAFSVPR